MQADYRKSIEVMEKVIALDPDFAMAYRSLAASYSNLGYQSEWEKYIEKAKESSALATEIERLIILGDYYDQSEKTMDKAIEAYEKILEIDPDHPWKMSLGIIYRNIGDVDKAMDIYESLLRAGDSSYLLHTNLSDAYMAKARFDDARRLLSDYEKKVGEKNWIHFDKSDSYIYEGKLDQAMAEVDKAERLAPGEPWIHGYRSIIYFYEGDLEAAEKSARKMMEDKEPRAKYNGWRGLSVIAIQRGQFERAKEEIGHMVDWARERKEAGTEAWCHRYLGMVSAMTGDKARALDELQKEAEIVKANEMLDYQRFNVYAKSYAYTLLDEWENAESEARTFKALVDESPSTRQVRYYHELMGYIELGKGNPEKAITHVMAMISMHLYGKRDIPATTLETLALAYLKSGEIDKAEETCQKISDLTTGRLYRGDVYARNQYNLGHIFEEKGEKENAAEHYRKFLTILKDADPGIFEVEDAKKRLARL